MLSCFHRQASTLVQSAKHVQLHHDSKAIHSAINATHSTTLPCKHLSSCSLPTPGISQGAMLANTCSLCGIITCPLAQSKCPHSWGKWFECNCQTITHYQPSTCTACKLHPISPPPEQALQPLKRSVVSSLLNPYAVNRCQWCCRPMHEHSRYVAHQVGPKEWYPSQMVAGLPLVVGGYRQATSPAQATHASLSRLAWHTSASSKQCTPV
jgi:hypothetical protein